MFPPKPFDCLEALDAFRFFFKYVVASLVVRGILDRKIAEEYHIQSSQEHQNKNKTKRKEITKNKYDIGKDIR